MKIVSTCPLCKEHALHIIGENELQTQQCISCGYVTAEKYKIDEYGYKNHKEYLKLTDEMKGWAKIETGRIWLPTIMTLPLGMLYPTNVNETDGIGEVGDKIKTTMKWAFSELVEIPEDERENYPDGNGGFYQKRFDTDNPKIYDTFLEGISTLSKHMKEQTKPEIKLPNLKKVKKDAE
jgi:Zn ribbon nucleic-acid-binding protein